MVFVRYIGRVSLLISILLLCSACGRITTYSAKPIPQNVRPYIYVEHLTHDPFGIETKLTSLLVKNGYLVLSVPNKNIGSPVYILSYTYYGYRDAFGTGNAVTSFTAKLHDQTTGTVFCTFESNTEAREGVVLDNFITEFIKVVHK